MVEVAAENLSAAWKTEQYKTLQSRLGRVLTLPKVLMLYGHAGAGLTGKTEKLGLNIVLT